LLIAIAAAAADPKTFLERKKKNWQKSVGPGGVGIESAAQLSIANAGIFFFKKKGGEGRGCLWIVKVQSSEKKKKKNNWTRLAKKNRI
jgi:hypothetical protein